MTNDPLTPPPADDATPARSEQEKPRLEPAGFWKRALAFAIDWLLLAVPCLVAGYAFPDYFISIGQQGRWYGAILFFAYFGLLNSSVGGGRTIGKRALGIAVVDAENRSIGLSKSLARAAVVALPIFLNGLQLSPSLDGVASQILLGTGIFGVGFLLLYLLAFNRSNRRSLHDFLAGSYVVKSGAVGRPGDLPRIWKGHFAFIGAIATAFVALGFVAQGWLARSGVANQFEDVIGLYRHLAERDDVRAVGVQYNYNARYHNGNTTRSTTLSIVVYSSKRLTSFQTFAQAIADDIFTSGLDIPDSDYLGITVGYGFDFGLAHGFSRFSFVFPPEVWKHRQADKATLADAADRTGVL